MKGPQLIINPGSSTMKMELFKGKKSVLRASTELKGKKASSTLQDFFDIQQVQNFLKDKPLQSIAIRVVHGGDLFKKPTKVNASNLKKLKKLDGLAPLHNPAAREMIQKVMKKFPRLPLWMIFDTSFHQDIPEIHQTYALPVELMKKHHIKRYGFHGTACASVMEQLKKKRRLQRKTIICHLGSGCSITAVKNGKSFATSMGFTPLEGLLMSTRSGDLDPGILLELLKKGMSVKKLEETLQQHSGLKALAGTADMREILQKAKKGNKKAAIAFHLFCSRIAEYIARYTILMGGVEQIVFSGGIGEHSPEVREHVCSQLEPLGIRISKKRNKSRKAGKQLQQLSSKAKIYFMHADEAAEMNRVLLQKS